MILLLHQQRIQTSIRAVSQDEASSHALQLCSSRSPGAFLPATIALTLPDQGPTENILKASRRQAFICRWSNDSRFFEPTTA
jgi:hypothetical protein